MLTRGQALLIRRGKDKTQLWGKKEQNTPWKILRHLKRRLHQEVVFFPNLWGICEDVHFPLLVFFLKYYKKVIPVQFMSNTYRSHAVLNGLSTFTSESRFWSGVQILCLYHPFLLSLCSVNEGGETGLSLEKWKHLHLFSASTPHHAGKSGWQYS